MWEFIKKYWDILGGATAGILLAVIAEFELESVQLYYSIIILVLVSIGIFRVIRQAVDKKKTHRKHNVVDCIIDGQKPIKAISLSQKPTEEGEKIGEIIIILWGVTKKTMEKLKTFWLKFKGYMLTIALAILTVVEMCAAPINTLCGGVLTVNGIELIPVVTLACTAVVGIVSNGFTPEQREKIKALFSKDATVKNELVIAEIKKTIKSKTAELAQLNKDVASKEHELATLEGEYANLNNTLLAKKQMAAMTPQLATTEEVRVANDAVEACRAKVDAKKAEIAKSKTDIENVTTIINALKSQL